MHNSTKAVLDMCAVKFVVEKLKLDPPKIASNIEKVMYNVTGIVAVSTGATGIDIGVNMQAAGKARKMEARNIRGIVALFDRCLANGKVRKNMTKSITNHTPMPNNIYSKIDICSLC